MTRPLIIALRFLLLGSPAGAQVTLDFAKITCNELFTLRVASADSVAVWLHGYFHGRSGNTNVESQEFKTKVENLKAVCRTKESKNTPVMQIFEKQASTPK